METTPGRSRAHEAALRRYYDRRAPEYEAVYHSDDPLRRRGLGELADALREALRGRRVLEVACGTGYWTALAAESAEHIVATDVSGPMLTLALNKGLPAGKVEFRSADAFDLGAQPGRFDAGLAMFWISHVPKARLREFLDGFHRRLGPGAAAFMADNVNVPDVGGPLIAKPGSPDGFKLRELSDGSRHEVLKNYYDKTELELLLAPSADDLTIHIGEHYWQARYRVSP